MTDAAPDSENFCYRHPDRQSYILCQRCGRTICPECQTQAAVGVHCPECVREARQSAPRTKPAILTAMRRSSDRPLATYAIIAITAVVFVAQLVLGNGVTVALGYFPPATELRPWTMLTALLVHGSPLHILSNMFSLFLIGPALEQMLGRGRFIALYLIAGFGGSVAVLLLSPGSFVVGASGAIFGLLGAYFIIARRLGGNTTQLVIVIALNLAIGFIIPSIAWQAHIGGLIVGAGVAFAFLQTRRIDQKRVQIALIAAIAALLIVITVVAITV